MMPEQKVCRYCNRLALPVAAELELVQAVVQHLVEVAAALAVDVVVQPVQVHLQAMQQLKKVQNWY